MRQVLKSFQANFSPFLLGMFWLIALVNPVFKKYDYGAGYPMIIIFAVMLIFLGVHEWRQKRERALTEQAGLYIFIVAVVVSFILSETRNLGFSEVLAFTSMATFYLLFAHQKITWIKKFLRFVMVGAIFSALLGFILYFFKAQPRMVGPFFNIFYHSNFWPNAFALFLLMAWPVFLIFLNKKDSARKNFGKILAVSLIFSALLLTFSRGAMIAFAGQIILMLIYFARRIGWKTILMVIMTAAISGGIFFGANYLRAMKYEIVNVEEKLNFENGEILTSKQERMDFWIGAIELIKEKPLFGYGPFSFRQAYNPIQKTFLGTSDHPHNVFLKIGAENGLIALGGIALFIMALFFTVAGRFNSLKRDDKDLVFILSVAVLGATAHNLIDYNFNFIANILLLFIFMAFIRSIVAKPDRDKMHFSWMIVTLAIALTAFYEGSLLILNEAAPEKNYEQYSLYPRSYYLNVADEAIKNSDFDSAIMALDKQITLNTLDDRAYYLKGAIYCNPNYEEAYDFVCAENFEKALTLNPMNELRYYADYIRVVEKNIFLFSMDLSPELKKYSEKGLSILDVYFDYVEKNVHFTAYTQNVEAAAYLVDTLANSGGINPKNIEDFQQKKEQMLKTANKLREEKAF